MKYSVQVSETLQRIIVLEADSAIDAEKLVRRQYRAGEIVLDSADYAETEISVVGGGDDLGSSVVSISQ